MLPAKKIIWLASYPKSGNTWFRILLSYILNRSKDLHYINDIDAILGSPMVAERQWMNAAAGFDTTLLSAEEIDQLRPGAYRWYAETLRQTTYIKIHDAYTLLENGSPLIPEQGCYAAIYFIRNPLDVAVSLAHHAKCPLDWSIEMMANQHFSIPIEVNRDKQLRQKLLTWSQHVQSWRSCPIKTLVLRYEDMLIYPLETFSKGLAFLNIMLSPSQLQQALDNTAFDKLQRYETNFGFKENPAVDRPFFRKGVVGDWKNILNKAQIEQIIMAHGDVMRNFGYVNQYNEPL